MNTSPEFIIFQSVIFGMIASIFLYTVIKYIVNPDNAILFYILYTISLMLLIFSREINALYLYMLSKFPSLENFREYVEILSGAGVVIFYLFFCINLVKTVEKQSRLEKIMLLLVYGFLIDLLLALVHPAIQQYIPESFMLPVIDGLRTIFILIAFTLIFFVIVSFIRYEDQLIRYLGLSSLFLFIGGAVFSLSSDHFPADISVRKFSYAFFQVMCIFQLFAFGILLNYKNYRVEKEKLQLASLNTAKSKFFANVSHEFRTPLTLILGPISDILKNKSYPEEQFRLELIQRNGQRLLRLINQILDLSKLDAGVLPVKKEPGDLGLFSQQILMSFSSLAEEKGVNLLFEAPSEDILFEFDRDHLEKIISNLVSNAIKYTPEGGQVTLVVGVIRDEDVFLEVRDTGAGIPAGQLPNIFDRFFQGNPGSFTFNLPSTGIGLALTKELVELHQGKIEVGSVPAQGSVFRITFPRGVIFGRQQFAPDTTPMPLSDPDLLSPVHEEALRETEKPVLLVIEDNEDILAYLERILIPDYQVIKAADGESGVEKAVGQVPDLIISDVMMPKKDGFTVIRELKSHEVTSHIPIIILTGKSSQESRLLGLKTDADDYLTKPFDASELLARIQNLLRNRRRLQKYYSRYLLLKPDEIQVTSMEEAFLKKVIGIIDQNIDDENFTVEILSQELLLDRTQLFNKLKKLVGKGPRRFIRSYRLERARQLLEANAATVTEIAFEVGFRDLAYFSRCFKEEFGISPSEVKQNPEK